ncbi:MAG: hypothetical protein HC892_19955 [Saprospiraceae bacterium]|nr:hypothetical protein [Saprospiraceae bacterium]
MNNNDIDTSRDFANRLIVESAFSGFHKASWLCCQSLYNPSYEFSTPILNTLKDMNIPATPETAAELLVKSALEAHPDACWVLNTIIRRHDKEKDAEPHCFSVLRQHNIDPTIEYADYLGMAAALHAHPKAAWIAAQVVRHTDKSVNAGRMHFLESVGVQPSNKLLAALYTIAALGENSEAGAICYSYLSNGDNSYIPLTDIVKTLDISTEEFKKLLCSYHNEESGNC